MAADDSRVGAVYVGWTTFNNALNNLADTMPNLIDKTVFPGLAGGVQSQLLSGLKFLGLIGKDNKPSDALRALAVKDEAERKKQMLAVLKGSYGDLFALDLAKTTTGELKEQMEKSYNVTGDTTNRAMRFFISAAEYAGIHLSAHVTGKKASNGTTTIRRRRTPRRKGEQPSGKTLTIPPSGGETKQVDLVSGGTLTLVASLGIMSLNQEDRKFVFELIDKFDEYAAKHPATPADDVIPTEDESEEV